jgi:hypothetical protein
MGSNLAGREWVLPLRDESRLEEELPPLPMLL